MSLESCLFWEGGAGKTYVYLRTIYGLNKKYGFKKFVIVAPSITIREGVLKNLEITLEHFQNLYDKTPVNFNVYNSRRVSNLRNFAVRMSAKRMASFLTNSIETKLEQQFWCQQAATC